MVVRRRAILERAEAAQEGELFPAEAGNIGEGLGARKDREQAERRSPSSG